MDHLTKSSDIISKGVNVNRLVMQSWDQISPKWHHPRDINSAKMSDVMKQAEISSYVIIDQFLSHVLWKPDTEPRGKSVKVFSMGDETIAQNRKRILNAQVTSPIATLIKAGIVMWVCI